MAGSPKSWMYLVVWEKREPLLKHIVLLEKKALAVTEGP